MGKNNIKKGGKNKSSFPILKLIIEFLFNAGFTMFFITDFNCTRASSTSCSTAFFIFKIFYLQIFIIFHIINLFLKTL